MVKEFKYNKLVDPEKLHKAIVAGGFSILGVVFDTGRNQTTVMLDDSETRDPSPIVESYVYVAPVFHNYPELFTTAKQTVTDSLTQYNSAVAGYVSAQADWNSTGTSVTTANAIAKLVACKEMVEATASAIEAAKDALTALVSVVTVLAKNNNLEQEEE